MPEIIMSRPLSVMLFQGPEVPAEEVSLVPGRQIVTDEVAEHWAVKPYLLDGDQHIPGETPRTDDEREAVAAFLRDRRAKEAHVRGAAIMGGDIQTNAPGATIVTRYGHAGRD